MFANDIQTCFSAGNFGMARGPPLDIANTKTYVNDVGSQQTSKPAGAGRATSRGRGCDMAQHRNTRRSPRRATSHSVATAVRRESTHVRRGATRMTVSIGVAALAVVVPVAPVASASSSDVPAPDRTALVLGGTTVPTPDQAYIDA